MKNGCQESFVLLKSHLILKLERQRSFKLRKLKRHLVLAKFEEAQDTIREADIMINGLVIANESMKIDIERLKDREMTLLYENGMHVENGLLSHGLCESNSIISDLKEHNYRTKQELHMCKILKGKLLVDIKNNFDRINKKEVEAREITIKLNNFAKNISDLQLQEEMMLQRSNEMGSQLAKLMRELDLTERMEITESLEDEILEMNIVFSQMNDSFTKLSSDLDDVTNKRDQL
ncbi:hypothetical protein JHK87_042474 [Glycine soja]|nr:hypothetical protein JHK87_042474 [Glycine soja]